MQRLTKVLTLLAVFSLLLAGNAPAAVTTVGLWQLGDDDPTASDGGSATTGTFGQAAIGTNLNLGNSGSVNTQTYTASTPWAGSTLATMFDGNDAYWTPPMPSARQDNFGIEAWAKPNNNTNPVGWVTNNGLAGGGWGIVQVGNTMKGHYSGVGDVGSAVIAPDEWTHYALVRDSGTATFYVNGIPSGTTSGATPNTPGGVLEIGYIHRSGVGDQEWFDGAIDHVRVFEFDAGQFDPATDLTLPPAGGATVIFTEDFESPVGDAWQIPSGATNFDNPVFADMSGGPWAGRMQQTENGLNPFSGNQFYEFNGSSTLDSSILFEVAAANTLANGTNLTVSLYSASLFSDTVDETFDVILSGGAVGTQSDIADSDPTVWQQHTFQFTVTDSTQAIDLEILATRDSTTAEDLLIDRITVEAAVPEPSTFALTAIGLLGLTLIGRRRRK